MSTKPNPGSDEAVALGCKCPRMDNCYGRGYRTLANGDPVFVTMSECKLHWIEGNPDLDDNDPRFQ